MNPRSTKALLLLLVLVFSGAAQILTLGQATSTKPCGIPPPADHAPRDSQPAPPTAPKKPTAHSHSHGAKGHSHARPNARKVAPHVEAPSPASRPAPAHCGERAKTASPCASDGCGGGCVPGERCCCEPGKPTNGQLCFMKAGCGGAPRNNGLFLPVLYGWDYLPSHSTSPNLRFTFQSQRLPVYTSSASSFRARPPTPPPRATTLPII